ncbi:hypothetical protein [Flavivirga eckloniae]|uniref:hypothetical protein n=1 Tax=Flavivirga eckloniae TaxID=1803846 RepID=UPI0013154B0A|nr:hypothetical protein [Flavivirga eckloniae]
MKTNVFVFVKNENGKQKFRAGKVNFFQRGDFRFVSVKTKFPEFLLEVINGELSYFVESHLKSRYTLNYRRKVYVKHKEKLYPINVGNDEKDFPPNHILPSNNSINSSVSLETFSSNDIYSSNFKWSFFQILGEDHTLSKLIKNNNFSIDDLEYLVNLSNKALTNIESFNKVIDSTLKRGYAKGYVINSKNDTINGSLKIKNRFILSEKLKLIDKSGNEFTYDPKELVGYKINDREYINDIINNHRRTLNKKIKGEICLYKDLENSKSYIKKKNSKYVLVDKTNKFLELLIDKKAVYDRIKANDYKTFEIKSIVRLYNNAQ